MEAPRDRPYPPGLTKLAALAGLVGMALGVVILESTDLGFDRAAAVTALLDWIPVTLGPVLLVLGVSIGILAAGASVGSLVRGRPYALLSDAVLEGAVWAVVVEVVLLALLAGEGLFRQPILLVGHSVVIVVGLARGGVVARDALRIDTNPSPLGALLVVAWAAPILLMLASPVVPFLDILPNHVAPAEHLRTFGTLTHLTDTQSPIYGPSRIFLGYTALLGAIATLTGLPAGAALAGFILPSTLAIAVALRRLAIAVGGPAVVPWALLLFATTTSFARLGDARATVVVLPLVTWALAELAIAIAGTDDASGRDAGAAPAIADAAHGRDGATHLPRGVLVGLALGSAMLVHPVIGFLAALTVGITVLIRPGRAAVVGIPALVTGGIVALPQVATMLGFALPPATLLVAGALGLGAGRLLAGPSAAALRTALVLLGRLAALGAAVAAAVGAGSVIPAAVSGTWPLVSVMELTVVAATLAVLLRARAARDLVTWAAVVAGLVVATATQLVPEGGSGLLGDALRFELPKTLQYWLPVFAVLLAAGGVEALATRPWLPGLVRGVLLAAFVGAVALPIRATSIDAFYLGEHRLSETISIAMRWVQSGFWVGFPSSRYVVDAPRQAILDAVRGQISAGRIGPDTPILHVAGSFQQWVATPLGVFDGVTETDVTPDAVVSIHTVGGRLRPIADLASLLAAGPPGGRTYAYVLFEPDPKDLPPGIENSIIGAGYELVFSNGQGQLYRVRSATR